MNKRKQPGYFFFAIGIIALGVIQFILKDFIVGRPDPLLTGAMAQEIWGYLSGAILVATGICILINKKARPALLVTGTIILLYGAVLHLGPMVTDAFKGNFHGNTFKCLAISGGAFILAASYHADGSMGMSTTDRVLVLAGRVFLAMFFIVCGVLHFQFFAFVRDFIPGYIPFHGFWAYFAGVALIAGGIGILIDKIAPMAAFLSGLMVFLWFILLHIPRAMAAPHDKLEWMGVFESLALSGVFFVLAGILRKK